MQIMIMANWTLKNIIGLFRQSISELDLDMSEGSHWSMSKTTVKFEVATVRHRPSLAIIRRHMNITEIGARLNGLI